MSSVPLGGLYLGPRGGDRRFRSGWENRDAFTDPGAQPHHGSEALSLCRSVSLGWVSWGLMGRQEVGTARDVSGSWST